MPGSESERFACYLLTALVLLPQTVKVWLPPPQPTGAELSLGQFPVLCLRFPLSVLSSYLLSLASSEHLTVCQGPR